MLHELSKGSRKKNQANIVLIYLLQLSLDNSPPENLESKAGKKMNLIVYKRPSKLQQ